jgi:hypothetical protein
MKKTRGHKPRKPRKSEHRVALAAHSAKSGITHVFSDIAEAQRLANQFKKAREAKLEIELINSISFWAWLNSLRRT